jgi:hypothetical protein
MKTRIAAIRSAIIESTADIKQLDQAVAFDRRVTAVQCDLRPTSHFAPRIGVAFVDSISRGFGGREWGWVVGQSDRQTAQQPHDRLEQLNAEIAKLRVLESGLRKFEQQLEAAACATHWPLAVEGIVQQRV